MLNQAYSEKRNYIRMRVDTPAHVSIEGSETALEGICRDLSGGGASIELDQSISPGTVLTVTVTSTHGHAPMLQVSGEVIRAEPGDDGQHVLGIKVIEVLK